MYLDLHMHCYDDTVTLQSIEFLIVYNRESMYLQARYHFIRISGVVNG